MGKEKNYSKLDAIIDFAIKEEKNNQKMYLDFAEKVSGAEQKALLQKLADMENGHAAKLQAFKESDAIKYTSKNTPELKVNNYVQESTVDESSSVREFLLFAINNEKKTHELYMTVRNNYVGTEDRELFESLANDELMHQQYLEKALVDYPKKF